MQKRKLIAIFQMPRRNCSVFFDCSWCCLPYKFN